MTFAGSALLATVALAAPPAGRSAQVRGAIAQIKTGSGLNTTINQSSQNLAINWQSFGVAANEAVRFSHP